MSSVGIRASEAARLLGSSPSAERRKRAEFFAAGTELFWIVSPDREEVEVWTSPDTHVTLCQDDILDGRPALPSFEIRVAGIFRHLGLGPRADVIVSEPGASATGR